MRIEEGWIRHFKVATLMMALIVALPSPGSAAPGGPALAVDPSPAMGNPADQAVPHGGGLACQYSYDDGTAETAYGIQFPDAGYETVWLNRFDTVAGCELIRAVEVAWSRPGSTHAVPAGSPARVFVWEDPNDDGNWTDAVLLAEQATIVQNPATNILNVVSLTAPVVVSGSYFVGASWVFPDAIERYPAALDTNSGIVAGRSFLQSFSGPFNASMLSMFPLNDLATLQNPGYFLLRASVRSATPITYQGRLVKNGLPVDGPADFRVSVFSTRTGGTQLGTTCEFVGVSVVGGLFTLELPTDPLIFDGSPHWLEIQVAHPTPGAFSTLTPRQQIARSPQADYAERTRWTGLMGVPAGFADGVDNGGTGYSLNASDGSPVNALQVDAVGNVGIGTTSPGQLLHVQSGSAGAVTQLPNSSFVVERSGNNYLSLLTPDASTKGIAFGSPADNDHGGIYYTNATGLDIKTGGNVVRMHIDPAGNVGVGTTTPEGLMHLFGGSAGAVTAPPNSILVLEDDVSTHIRMITPEPGTSGVSFGNPTDSDMAGVYFNSPAIYGLNFRTGGNNTRMVIDSLGAVGINTQLPSSKLTIYEPGESVTEATFTQGVGSAGLNIVTDYTVGAFTPGLFWSTSVNNETKPKAGIYLQETASGSLMHLGTSNNYTTGMTNSAIVIDPAGNVGIGAPTPTAKLHVGGTAGTDGIKFPDGTLQTTAGAPATHSHSSLDASDGNPAGALSLDANGFVGIGTTTPEAPLHVLKTSAGSVTANSFSALVVEGQFISILNPDNQQGGILMGNPTQNNNAQIVFNGGGASNDLEFRLGGSVVRMRINASGSVNVIGNLSVGGALSAASANAAIKAFKIDHPLDPENKYLYHSSVESPDMKNIYDGVVTTDAAGYATISLPEWFEALNRDFRYQLTVIDDTDAAEWVMARVVKKIAGNQFTIRSSRPGVEVSWQVTGIRHDAVANARRIVPEVDKEPENKGRYLSPDAFGLPHERGIFAPNEQAAAAESVSDKARSDAGSNGGSR